MEKKGFMSLPPELITQILIDTRCVLAVYSATLTCRRLYELREAAPVHYMERCILARELSFDEIGLAYLAVLSSRLDSEVPDSTIKEWEAESKTKRLRPLERWLRDRYENHRDGLIHLRRGDFIHMMEYAQAVRNFTTQFTEPRQLCRFRPFGPSGRPRADGDNDDAGVHASTLDRKPLSRAEHRRVTMAIHCFAIWFRLHAASEKGHSQKEKDKWTALLHQYPGVFRQNAAHMIQQRQIKTFVLHRFFGKSYRIPLRHRKTWTVAPIAVVENLFVLLGQNMKTNALDLSRILESADQQTMGALSPRLWNVVEHPTTWTTHELFFFFDKEIQESSEQGTWMSEWSARGCGRCAELLEAQTSPIFLP